jgi:hypothetical protein
MANRDHVEDDDGSEYDAMEEDGLQNDDDETMVDGDETRMEQDRRTELRKKMRRFNVKAEGRIPFHHGAIPNTLFR